MSATYDRTTELLKALSLLNRLDGIRKADPENPARIYSGGESGRLKIRQELVQLADRKLEDVSGSKSSVELLPVALKSRSGLRGADNQSRPAQAVHEGAESMTVDVSTEQFCTVSERLVHASLWGSDG